MASFLSHLRRILTGSRAPSSYKKYTYHGRSIDTDFSVFREGDRVLIHGKSPILSKPLRRNDKTPTPRGHVEHDDIIGQAVRGVIRSNKGALYRVTYPTLEEYATLTPRLVTPVYAADANLIVSLLDIHTHPSQTPPDEPLEILEAGTGHGSLTLHLARAIHAANPPPPPIPSTPSSQRDTLNKPSSETQTQTQTEPTPSKDKDEKDPWTTFLSHRSAILHTVDVNATYSAHAAGIVRGFRRGMYAGNVDFHVSKGGVEAWIEEQCALRRKSTSTTGLLGLGLKRETRVKPFLSYAILDMPSAHLRIGHVASVLKADGVLAVFMPNVTQIGDCVNLIRDEKLPFVMERTVELGTGISSGRLWDVRVAQTKSRGKLSTTKPGEDDDVDAEDTSEQSSTSTTSTTSTDPTATAEKGQSVLVCRPKVGERIVGGGFVGIWRRMKA